MISFSQAQIKLKELCESWLLDVGLASESRSLPDSLGFYLSEDLYATDNLPREDVSAMDGYALCVTVGSSIVEEHTEFLVCGESRAGQPYFG